MYAQHLIVLAVCFLLTAPAGAQELTGTLKKIDTAQMITLGHRESSIPFSYYDDKQQVVGYSHEIMLKVVDTIKHELHLPDLRIKLVPINSQNRVALIQNGTVDLECGSTSNTAERQQAQNQKCDQSLYLHSLITSLISAGSAAGASSPISYAA